MNTLQPKKNWTLRSIRDGLGRRRLIFSHELAPLAARRRGAPRQNGGTKLAVTFAPVAQSGFKPVIRTIS